VNLAMKIFSASSDKPWEDCEPRVLDPVLDLVCYANFLQTRLLISSVTICITSVAELVNETLADETSSMGIVRAPQVPWMRKEGLVYGGSVRVACACSGHRCQSPGSRTKAY